MQRRVLWFYSRQVHRRLFRRYCVRAIAVRQQHCTSICQWLGLLWAAGWRDAVSDRGAWGALGEACVDYTWLAAVPFWGWFYHRNYVRNRVHGSESNSLLHWCYILFHQFDNLWVQCDRWRSQLLCVRTILPLEDCKSIPFVLHAVTRYLGRMVCRWPSHFKMVESQPWVAIW